MNKGSTFKDIDIHEIPKQWANFPNSDDEWVLVDMPKTENLTACIYHGKKGSFFKPHKHSTQVEQLVVLSGKLEVITYDYIDTMKFPESTSFKKGEVHAVEFLEDSKILVMWSPRFSQGLEVEFQK